MFRRYVFVEGVDTIFDLDARAPVSQLTFDVRLASLGDPSSNKDKASAQFKRAHDRRTLVQAITYRPGQGAFVEEARGLAVNAWRSPPPLPDLPHEDGDIALWLDHLAYLLPDCDERETLINWMAWVVQHQDIKPNWGVILGGVQGTGKSLVILPLKKAIGEENVSVITTEMLSGQFTNWLYRKKLFVVEELGASRDKQTDERLKMYLTNPPDVLPINMKYGPAFEVPNILAGWFTTNHRDALAIDPKERRFFCLWSEAEPRPAEYYSELVKFYADGGAAKVALWLCARDLKGFTALGMAPITRVRSDMVDLNRDRLDEVLQRTIAEAQSPFVSDLVILSEVFAELDDNDFGRRNRTEKGLGIALLRAGAVPLGRHYLKNRPANVPESLAVQVTNANLFAVRNGAKYKSMNGDELRNAFWTMRSRTAILHGWRDE